MNETYKGNMETPRKTAVRRRRANMRNIYIACGFLAAAILLIMCMFLFFNVSDIKIEGVTLYEDEQILVVGGVQTGQNLVRTNTDIVEQRLKNTLVYIDDVKVTKKFPSTLVISCTEAKKAADIEDKGSYYVVSTSGKILEVKNPDTTGDIPVVKGFELKSKEQGSDLESEDSFKADILKELLSDLDELGFENIDTIDITTRSDIKLMYDGRIEIKMGSSVDMEYKLTYLKYVIDNSFTKDYEGTLIYNGADSGISAIPKDQTEDANSSAVDSKTDSSSDSSAVQADTTAGDNQSGQQWTADDTQGYGDNTDNNDYADNTDTTWGDNNNDNNGNYGYTGDDGYGDNADNGNYGGDQGYTDNNGGYDYGYGTEDQTYGGW